MFSATSPTSRDVCVQGVGVGFGGSNTLVEASSATECQRTCVEQQECVHFTWHPAGCTYGAASCSLAQGCCHLRTAVVDETSPVVNQCACSAYVRVPGTQQPVAQPPPAAAPNLLYLIVDDLRPELEVYNLSSKHYTPYTTALANRGVTFMNAHAQISICAPSRNSFLTGHRPDSLRIYNFLNHWRQAECGTNVIGQSILGTVLRTVEIKGCGPGSCGAHDQCGTLCTEDPACAAWRYHKGNMSCVMLWSGWNPGVLEEGAVSGVSGSLDRARLESLPQYFRNRGWLTMSTGKIFHTEEGGWGSLVPDENGPGLPPNMDPPSWSEGLSMRLVNSVATQWNCNMLDDDDCVVDASVRGVVDDPATQHQLADRIITDDALLKLRLGAANRKSTEQPFFLAVGFRKPHAPYRFPRPFLQQLPPMDKIKLARHRVFDPSQPAVAHNGVWQSDAGPYEEPGSYFTRIAQRHRLFYRASVSWVDSLIGEVMEELDASGEQPRTMVVLHSDHGYSLGEHGVWQKMTNFEHGTRVPMIISAPWMNGGGRTVNEVVELIDVFPTMADALGVPTPPGQLDGKSLLPLLDATRISGDGIAISQYPRCQSTPGTWRNTDCMFTDRSMIQVMGYSVRTKAWRFTEWYRWDGQLLRPDWNTIIATELYNHEGDDGSSFDEFENVNEAAARPDAMKALRLLLHERVDAQFASKRARLAVNTAPLPPLPTANTTMPDTTMPDTTMHGTTMPDTTMPDSTGSNVTATDATLSNSTLSNVTVPDAKVPVATWSGSIPSGAKVPDSTWAAAPSEATWSGSTSSDVKVPDSTWAAPPSDVKVPDSTWAAPPFEAKVPDSTWSAAPSEAKVPDATWSATSSGSGVPDATWSDSTPSEVNVPDSTRRSDSAAEERMSNTTRKSDSTTVPMPSPSPMPEESPLSLPPSPASPPPPPSPAPPLSSPPLELSECDRYRQFGACSWTEQFACPNANNGGGMNVAIDDGSKGFYCCCIEPTKSLQSRLQLLANRPASSSSTSQSARALMP